MSARPLVLLCAALMLGSLFLPWFLIPGGGTIVPWDFLKTLDASQYAQLLQSQPPEQLAFFGSFALAAVLVLLGLMGSSPRLIVFLTGALPVGLVGWSLYSAMSQGNALGVPVQSGDLMQILRDLSGFLGAGAWAWIGGGAVLFLLGLFGSSRR